MAKKEDKMGGAEKPASRRVLKAADDRKTFRAILEKAPYGIILLDRDGTFSYVNQEFTRITGYTLKEVPTGREWLRRAYPDDEYRKRVVAFWRNDVSHTGIDRIFRVTCMNGACRDIEFRPFLLDDGRAVTILSDITQKRRMEEVLRESEEKFRILFEDSYDAIYINRRDGSFMNVNRAFLELFGWAEEDLKVFSAADLYAVPEERVRFQRLVEDNGFLRDYNVLLKKRDGTLMECCLTTSVRRGPDGGIAGYQGIIRDVTAQRRLEEELRSSEARYRTIFEATGAATTIVDEKSLILMANRGFEVLSGFTRAELEGMKSLAEFIDAEDVERLTEYDGVMPIRPGTAPRNYEFRFVDRFGNEKHIQATVATIPGVRQSIVSLLDMTEQGLFRASLARSVKTMRDIIESAPLGIYIVNAKGDVDYVNQAMLNISGATREQFLALNVLRLPGYQRTGIAEKVRGGLAGEHFRIEGVEYTSNFGRRTTIRNFIGIPFEEAGERKLLMFVEDITRQKFNELQLAYLATHDTLTGLPNRSLFNDRLNIAIAHANRFSEYLAVLLFDLDRFKDVNDVLGHKVGDGLLKAVGDRAASIIRQTDTVARMGGDEFLVMLPNLGRAEYAETIAEKLLDALRMPYDVEGHPIEATASLGVAVYPDDAADSVSLVRCADIAMYKAKQSGRNCFRRYVP